jgi:predicted nucleic acid-binding protein
MIVVDAGAVFEYVVWRGFGAPVASALAEHEGEAFAPQVLDLEVLHVLRRASRFGADAARAASEAATTLRELPVERVLHEPLLERVWDLRDHCTAHDASYVALAEHLGPGTRFLTTDRRLARAVHTLGTVEVDVVPVR